MMVAFGGALAISVFVGALLPLRRVVRGLLTTGGVGLLAMPFAGLSVTGVGPLDALADPHIAGTVGVDVTFVVLGVLLLVGALRAREPSPAA